MKNIRRKSKWMALCMLIFLVLSACTPKGKSSSSEEGPTPTPEPLAEDQKFVLVSGSKFLMGSEGGAPLSREDEYPQHEVILTSFFIMKREVTNLEYRSCMEAGICTTPLVEEQGPSSFFNDLQFNNWPVTGVDWFQAQKYCEWIEARLPSEAEWEKAARGRDGGIFPWGDAQPTCDLANSQGCEEETNTARVLSYPQGESPYKLTETAGNVREWTSDWYQPDYYTDQVVFEPFGPKEGELKVTRGGAWNDGAENLRTTARIPMDPREQSDQVGFRCVSVGRAVAPVCTDTFRNYCDDPRVPRKPGDEPCVPEEESGDCGGTSIASFGCPDDGLVTVSFSTPAGGEADVNIGTSGFDCEQGDGVITCTGPAQEMGSNVTVTVCGPPPPETEQEPVSAVMNISSILMSHVLDPIFASLTAQAGMQNFGFCPDGYEMDEESGACVKQEQQPPCPEGWTPDTRGENIICIPDGPESCPENTEFNKETETCDLLDPEIGCPPSFETNLERQICTPPMRRLSPCLPGYWMDSELGCCIPLENPCQQQDAYFEARVDDCLPTQPGGCPDCTYLDEYEGCIPIPGCEPGAETGAANSAMALLPAGMGALQPDCYPDDTSSQGDCSPPTGDGSNECSNGYVFAPDLQTGLLTCLPAYGPGSGCPRGYIMDPRVNCCVPLENPCPDPYGQGSPNPFMGEISGVTNPGFGANFFGAGDAFASFASFGTNFNPYGGDCENNEGGCPPGTTMNNDGGCEGVPGSLNGCPPGSTLNDDGGCEGEPTGLDGCPPGTTSNDDGGCEDVTRGSTALAMCPAGCWSDYDDPTVCQCETDDCPPGTTSNDDGGCEVVNRGSTALAMCPAGCWSDYDDPTVCQCETDGGTALAQCPSGCWPGYDDPNTCQCEPTADFTCPEGDCWQMDTYLNTCTWTCGTTGGGEFNPCDSDNQVWIPELELCVPRGDDCCPPGYDWSTVEQVCLPIFQQGFALMPNMGEIVPDETQSECSEGYEFVDGICVLASRRGEERCCWTTSVNVPVCIGPCKIGTQLNTATGICEKPKPASSGGGGSSGPTCGCSLFDCNDIGNKACYGKSPCC